MNQIKAIRERLGVTQESFGEGIGCTQGNVGHYEKGQTVPPEAAKRLISYARSKGLELTLDQIYGLATLPPPASDFAHGVSRDALRLKRREGPDSHRDEKTR